MINRLTNALAAKLPKLRPVVVYYRARRKRIIAGFFVIAHVLGAWSSVNAIMEARTSQGAIAWAVVLNTFPYVAVPAFWIFGHSDFEDYVVARQENYGVTTEIHEKLSARIRDGGFAPTPQEPRLAALEHLAKLPLTSDNAIDLLIDGEATFDAIVSAIDAAEDYILVQYFIFRDDDLGQRLADRLIARAHAGVRVYLIYDEIGSMATPARFWKAMRDAGIKAIPFNTTKGPTNNFRINFRNHRKVVVVDGEVGFVGGLNVGVEYLGEDPELSPWRDTHCRFRGPVVQTVQIPFIEDWAWASGEVPADLNWEPAAADNGDGGMEAICIPSGPADQVETCSLFFINAINAANDRVWIASPYFVPDEQVVSALELAALRGVDVRVLIPAESDSFLVQLSSFSYLAEAENSGFEIYRYNAGFLHQKVVLVDDDFASVGTANFDNRSFRLNFEITLAVHDRTFAGRVAEMLEADFQQATIADTEEIAEKPFYFRFATRVARLLGPIQ